MSTPRVPMLPNAAIREALETGQLEIAMSLMADHERQVRDALADPIDSGIDRPTWLALLAEQNSLLEHLQDARAKASAALQRVKSNRDSVRAYKDGSGR